MGTFTIDILSGNEYLFTGNFGTGGSGTTSTWNTLSGRPIWLTATTLSAFQLAHKHSQYLTGVTWNQVSSKPTWVGSGITTVSLVGNQYRIYTPANTSIQLVDHSGNTDVNVIIPIPIIWTTQEYPGDNIIFTGGSRIYVTKSANYKISYTLNVVNQTNTLKVIGSLIRKNGDGYVTPLTSTSYAINTINDTGTNVMPLFALSLNHGDYIELIGFRVGVNSGGVTTVPSGSWIRMEEMN